MSKKFLVKVFTVIMCISILGMSSLGFAATSTERTGTTSGGGYGKATVTYKINGNDSVWPVHDFVYAYTKCNVKLDTYVMGIIYGSGGVIEGIKTNNKITDSRVEVYVYADDASATKGESQHQVGSSDYGNFTSTLTCSFN